MEQIAVRRVDLDDAKAGPARPPCGMGKGLDDPADTRRRQRLGRGVAGVEGYLARRDGHTNTGTSVTRRAIAQPHAPELQRGEQMRRLLRVIRQVRHIHRSFFP